LLALAFLTSCSMFRAAPQDSKADSKPDGKAESTQDGKPDSKAESKETPPEGTLKVIATVAPGNSATQLLARIADDLGWESQVAQDAPLRKAVEKGDFDRNVLPFLLALYYRNGFSVLPRVGEGHQFARDSIVRGVVGTSRLLVTTRDPLKLIFLDAVDNVQVVYPQDGQSPQIFTLNGKGVIAVRRSQLEQYLQ
jgi:hypothetical protein